MDLDLTALDTPTLYPLVRRAIAETPWALLPIKLAEMLEVVNLRARGVRFSTVQIQERIGAAPARPQIRSGAGVAVLPLVGIMAQRMDMMTEMSGGTSTELFGLAFRQALSDPSVGSIVIDVDSPGGSVTGTPELADEIYKARGQKRVVAVANSLAASAAYWVGTAADELVVTPSGLVGSIGVIAAHEDDSGMLEQMGVKVTLVSAGEFKAEGNPYEPLSDEGLGAMQKLVDDYYAMFVRAVAKQRGKSSEEVRSGFGRGRVVGAREAVALGMADRVGTLQDVVRELASPRRRAASTGAVDVAGDLDVARFGLLARARQS